MPGPKRGTPGLAGGDADGSSVQLLPFQLQVSTVVGAGMAPQTVAGCATGDTAGLDGTGAGHITRGVAVGSDIASMSTWPVVGSVPTTGV